MINFGFRNSDFGIACGIIVCVLLIAVTGCQPATSQEPAGTGAAASGGGLAPLPAKALLKLSELTPPIAKPVNDPAGTKPLSQQGQAAFDESKRLADQGDRAGAIERLERAITFDPKNSMLRRSLGLQYAGMSDFGKAMDNIRQAVATAPNDLDSQLLMGIFLAGNKRDDQAITALRTALLCTDSSPSNPLTAEATYRLGLLLQENAYWTAALDCFQQVSNGLEKNSSAYATRQYLKDVVLQPERLQTRCGELLLQLRNPAAAAEQLQKSFDSNHTDMYTAKLLLGARISLKEFAKAEKLLVDMAGESAQSAQLSLLAESLCRASNDPAMPGRIWNAFRKHNNSEISLAISLARISERLGQKEQAVKILSVIEESMPGNLQVAGALAGLYARTAQCDKALTILAGALDKNPGSAAAIAEGLELVVLKDAKGQAAKTFTENAVKSKSPAAIYVAGKLATMRGDYPAAIALFGQTIDAKRDYFPAYEGLVDVNLEQDKYDSANNVLAGLSAQPVSEAFVCYLRGKIKLDQRQYAEAAKDFEASAKLDRKFVPNALLWADALIQSGQPDVAENILFPTLEANPDETLLYRKLFEVCLAARRYTDAQLVIAKLRERQPQSLQAIMMLGELNLVSEKTAAASGIIGQLLEQAGDNVDVNLLAARLALAGSSGIVGKPQFEAALKYADSAVKTNPRDIRAQQLKASLYAVVDQFDKASGAYKNLHELYPGRTDIARLYASALSLSGQNGPAAALLEKLAAADPKDIDLRRDCVSTLAKDKQYDKAESLLLGWIKTDDGKNKAAMSVYRESMVNMFALAKQYDKALKYLDQWLPTADSAVRLDMFRQKVAILGTMGQTDKAVALVSELASKNAEKTIPRETLIAVLMDKKEYDKAVALLDEWISKKVSDQARTDVFCSLKISNMVKAGRIDQAVAFANTLTAEKPDNLDPRKAMIGSLIGELKFDQAHKLVAGWLAKMPATQPTTNRVPPTAKPDPTKKPNELRDWLMATDVQLLRLMEKPDESMRKADAALAVNPNNIGVLNEKATMLIDAGKVKEGLAMLEKVLSLEPNSPSANNNLGYNYAEFGINLDKAENMLKQALSVSPYELSFQDSLAWIYYKKGQFGKAAEIFRTMLRSRDGGEDVENAVLYDHAGDAYYRLGWSDKAVGYWSKALELAKKDKFKASDIKAVLKNVPEKINAVKAGKTPNVSPLAQAPAQPIPTTKPAAATKPSPATQPAKK